VQVELASEIKRRFRTALRKAGSVEIGGMLFAEQLAPSNFKVIDFSFDPDSGSHSAFQRRPQSHQKALDEFFKRTGNNFQRFNYLGEWHSHPSFPALPSCEDIRTMSDIVEDPRSAITFAVLLVVRLRLRLWLEHSFALFARGQAARQVRYTSQSRS